MLTTNARRARRLAAWTGVVCAAGPLYRVPAVVTLSNPVKACSSSGTRWFWTRATFRYPDGLPKALQGENAPQNPRFHATLHRS